ncbi:MAG: hypothetical protein Q4C70_04265 [Planctomycetia bacterium]|nr:hypothetical protein [Planctomycetia bacterium]
MNYPSKAPPIPTGELSETIGITPFEVTSITFVPNQTTRTVTFSDASTDDVQPSYGPYIDNVSSPAKYVIADIDVDSNNDGSIDVYDDPIESNTFGKVVLPETVLVVYLGHIQNIPLSESEYGARIRSSNESIIPSATDISLGDEAYIFSLGSTSGIVQLTYEIYRKSDNTVIATDEVNVTVMEIKVDMAFNYARNENNGCDGLNIRENGEENTEFYGPELTENDITVNDSVHGTAGDRTVLYLANQEVDVYTRFVISPGFANEAIEFYASCDMSMEGLAQRSVDFNSNGVSDSVCAIGKIGEEDATGFVKFDAISTTSETIAKETSTFTWYVDRIGGLNGFYSFDTAPLTVYTVLDTPKISWEVENTDGDDQLQPWATALEFAIGTAGAQGTDLESLEHLTQFLYSGHGMSYNMSTESAFCSNRGVFDLQSYIDHEPTTQKVKEKIHNYSGNEVNCLDQAMALAALGRLLGMEVEAQCLLGFGYLRSTAFVCGYTPTNNLADTTPVFPTDRNQKMFFEKYLFVTYRVDKDTTYIYDACCGPAIGMNFDCYYETFVDEDANSQYNRENPSPQPLINSLSEDMLIIQNFPLLTDKLLSEVQ